MQLTPEQERILQTDGNLVINAVAGSGKTTTLIAYAGTRPAQSRILYLAFNRTVRAEAQQKFAAAGLSNVTVATAHSLAFDYVVKRSNYQVVAGYKSYELCGLLGIDTGDRHTDFIIGNHVGKFISYFCNSAVLKVQQLNYADVISDAKAKIFVDNFYSLIEQFTREALAKMDKGEIAITHDFYLKKFQLSQPVLPYDYILFDEGQDASGAMLAVFLQQPAIRVITGDVHQQIYGWRYAVNSLQQVDFPMYPLSSSFRFDEEIALVANKLLGWKKHLQQPPAVKITGAGQPGGMVHTRATLGRTNFSLLLNAIAQWQQGGLSKIYFEGNISSYTFAEEGASLYDVLSLYNGKTGAIKDKLIADMGSITALEAYIEKTEDHSLGIMVEVVKEFGNRLPGLISELKSNHTTVKEEADMIFSTVHRCKGMEYDEVTLLKDFITEEKLKQYIAQSGGDAMTPVMHNRLAEEVNILYVAVTRAKQRLRLPPEINPLQSIELAGQPMMAAARAAYPHPFRSNDYQHSAADEPMTPSRKAFSSGKAPNSGKRWNAEDLELLEQLYLNGSGLKAMAAALARGEKAVQMKLVSLGLIEEDEYL